MQSIVQVLVTVPELDLLLLALEQFRSGTVEGSGSLASGSPEALLVAAVDCSCSELVLALEGARQHAEIHAALEEMRSASRH